jgi:propionyl-CoA carboxylase beta chain
MSKTKFYQSLSARERLELLFDPGTFKEFDKMSMPKSNDVVTMKDKTSGDGVVTGHGLVNGRTAYAFSQDVSVLGGTLSDAFAEKICKIMDKALLIGAPLIGLNDSGYSNA